MLTGNPLILILACVLSEKKPVIDHNDSLAATLKSDHIFTVFMQTFEDLVDILDPEMNMADEDALFDDEPQEMEDKEAGSTSPEKNENQEFE